MPDQKPLISVVIPTHNRSDALAQTLSKLAEQEFTEPWEVIVVNHRCTDDTDEVVRRQKFPTTLRLVHRGDTPGVAAARNAGAAAAVGQYLLFLDDDILVEPDFLRRHSDALKAHPGCWIMGQLMNLPEQERTPFGRFRRSLFSYDPPNSPLTESRGMTGQSISMPRADFERTGGFDETFSIASVEDFDLAMRANKLGIKILYAPAIMGIHNDWAGFTIRDYCQRQQTYTRCEPLLWAKYGEQHPRPMLVYENYPPRWGTDSARLLLRKMSKRVAGAPPVRVVLFGACGLLERVWPWPPVLWQLYRFLLSGAIYKGFQEGLESHQIKLNGSDPK
jgi:GT2 family glycosyltransferase